MLFYVEGGGRVRAFEPVVSARRVDGDERSLGLKFTFDSLTGASPNGAAPQPTPQTFTSPSGGSTYTTAAGATPLDPTFRDQRAALAFSFERPLGAANRLALGLNASSEYDFQSIGASVGWATDFNERNTTASLGLAFEADRIKPVGGMPVGLRPAFGTLAERQADQTRNVLDLLAGITQVMRRNWLMQFNLAFGRGSGHHSDPYKILSVVDGTTGLVSGDRYVSEERPRQRTRTSVYWQHKVHLNEDVIDLSLRAYRDDWGVRASTLDARYRFELGGGLHLEPHGRWYRQSAADFWRGWLVEGSEWSSTAHRANVAVASADPRLAAFTANTIGLKFGGTLAGARWFGRDAAWNMRFESYRQRQDRPSSAPGALQALDLAPGLRATSLVLGLSSAF